MPAAPDRNIGGGNVTHANFDQEMGNVGRIERDGVSVRSDEMSAIAVNRDMQSRLEETHEREIDRTSQFDKLNNLISNFNIVVREDRQRRISQQYGSSPIGRINAALAGAYLNREPITARGGDGIQDQINLNAGRNRNHFVGGPSWLEELGLRGAKVGLKTAAVAGAAGVGMLGLAAFGGLSMPALGAVAGGLAAGRGLVEATRIVIGKERRLRKEIEEANHAVLESIRDNYRVAWEKRRSLEEEHAGDVGYNVETDPEYIGMLTNVVDVLHDDAKRRVRRIKIPNESGRGFRTSYQAVAGDVRGNDIFSIAEKQDELRKLEKKWETIADISSSVTGVGTSVFHLISTFWGTTVASSAASGLRPAADKLLKTEEKKAEIIADHAGAAKAGFESLFPTKERGGAAAPEPQTEEAPEEEKNYNFPNVGQVVSLSGNPIFRHEIGMDGDEWRGVDYFEFKGLEFDSEGRPLKAVLIPLVELHGDYLQRTYNDGRDRTTTLDYTPGSEIKLDVKYFEEGKNYVNSVEGKHVANIPVAHSEIIDDMDDEMEDDAVQTVAEEGNPEASEGRLEAGTRYQAISEEITDAHAGRIKIKVGDNSYQVVVKNFADVRDRVAAGAEFNFVVDEAVEGEEPKGRAEFAPERAEAPTEMPEILKRGGEWSVISEDPAGVGVRSNYFQKENVPARSGRGSREQFNRKSDRETLVRSGDVVKVYDLSTNRDKYFQQVRYQLNNSDGELYGLGVHQFLKYFRPKEFKQDEYNQVIAWCRRSFGHDVISDEDIYHQEKNDAGADNLPDYNSEEILGSEAKSFFEANENGEVTAESYPHLISYAKLIREKDALGFVDSELHVTDKDGQEWVVMENTEAAGAVKLVCRKPDQLLPTGYLDLGNLDGANWQLQKEEPKIIFDDGSGGEVEITRGQRWNLPGKGSMEVINFRMVNYLNSPAVEIVMRGAGEELKITPQINKEGIARIFSKFELVN